MTGTTSIFAAIGHTIDLRGRGRLAGIVALVSMLALIAGCGGSDGSSATVEITSVSPETTYPGVETTVDFSMSSEDVDEADLGWEVRFGDNTSESGEGSSGSVSHTWDESGQYTLEVAALDDGTVVGSTTRRLDVLVPIDLAVGNIRAQPPNVETGESFQVLFDIENLSPTSIDTPFDVEVYLTEQTSASVEDLEELTELGTATVGVSDGTVVDGTTTRRVDLQTEMPDDVESGDYYMVVYANPERQFADENPDDNLGVSDSIVRVSGGGTGVKPDVAVEDVYVIPDRAYPALNRFSRGFTLRNEGGGEAFEVETTTYLSVGDDELDDSDRRISTSDETVDIPAGETVEVGPDQFVLDEDITPMDGEETVYVIVEATLGDENADPDLDNNIGLSDPPITVSEELADGPDIAVEEFSVTPEKTYLNGSLDVSMTIANQGTADVETFICRLYLGDEPRINMTDSPLTSLNVPSLASEESRDINRSVTVPGTVQPGTYYIYTVCDPNGSLDETYRNNNQKVYPNAIEVTDEADVDLFVDELSVPKTADEGDEVTLTASVCVNGSNASGITQGALYETTGTSVDFDEEPVQTFDLPNVNPGGCKDVDLTFTASCDDFEENYAYGIDVDTQDQLPERDEQNNKKRGSNVLQIDGEYCKCEEDNFEPNDKPREAYTLGSGTTSGAVCDAGSCDYYGVTLDESDTLRVMTTYDEHKGALETTLFDPSGVTSIDADSAPGLQRVGAFNVPNDATYIFRICGANSDSRNLYDLDVDVVAQKDGVDLVPRKVEIPSQNSFSIGETLEASLRIHNIGTDPSAGFDVGLTISPDRTIGDGNDVALTPSTVAVDSVAGGSSKDVTVDVELPSSLNNGDYYIGAEIDPSGALTEESTANNVSFSRSMEVETRCYDPLEPNDSLSRARSIQNGGYNGLVACATSDDYYELCVDDGKKFNITTEFNDKNGDIDMELYDQHFNVIDSSAQTGVDKEKVSVDYVNGQQCYYARTFVLTTDNTLETTYDMTVDVQDVPPNLQCDSHFEPNDDFSTATSYIAGVEQTALLDRCPAADTDYYRLELNRGQKISLRGILEPSSQSGSLRLQLYKPNRQPTKNASTAPGIPVAELKDYVAPTSGTYFVQVTLSGSTRKVTYELEEDGLGGLDLAADSLWFWGGQYDGGETLKYQFDLANRRSDTATSPTYRVYLGDKKSLDATDDTELDSVTRSDLSGNTTETVNNQVALPQSVPSGETRYIHIRVEADSSQTDPNQNNNVATRAIDFK